MPNPTPPQAMLEEALAAHRAGRIPEARLLYRQLLASEPQNVDILGLLGTVECQAGAFVEGIRLFERSLELVPAQPRVRLNLGTALVRLGRLEAALAAYDGALATAPELVEAWFAQANALGALGRLEEALFSYDRALALRPDFAEAHNNRGNALKDLGRFKEARASYEAAVGLRPAYAEACHNLGNILHKLGQLEEAIAWYGKALAIRPDFADVRWSLALAKLLQGDYEEGWRLYEWRWKRRGATPGRPFQAPLWLGKEDIQGRTLLIHPEQGLGDCLQFCRYALLARARGAEVIIEAPQPLAVLLASLGEGCTVVPEGEALPPFDFHCPIMSLPLAFGTRVETIPVPEPYLFSDPQKVADWRAILGPRTRPRIGLFWKGGDADPHRAPRSLPLSALEPILALPLEFHSLQRELPEDETAQLRDHPAIRTHPACSMDFPGTAALIETLDLVISIDSSIAHLAGAMGKRTWIPLPFLPDYRWMLDRDDTPWYPTAHLFRQSERGNWSPVIRALCDALESAFAEG